MGISNTNPSDIILADRLQLGLSVLGDGFFPLKGSVTIGGITQTAVSLVGQIVPGTGLQIKVRDYAALVSGIVLTNKNIRQINFNTFTNVSIPGAGTWYITLAPVNYLGYDSFTRPDWTSGIFYTDTQAPLPLSGKILVGVVSVPSSLAPVVATINVTHVGSTNSNGTTLTVNSTAGLSAGMMFMQGTDCSPIVSITNSTKLVVAALPNGNTYTIGGSKVVTSGQITTSMIDNSQKQFLDNLETVANAPTVPATLVQQVNNLQTAVTALQNQVQQGFIVDHQIVAADLDPSSTVAIDPVTGNFILGPNQATVYMSESFTGANNTPFSDANFFGGLIENNQLMLVSPSAPVIQDSFASPYINTSIWSPYGNASIVNSKLQLGAGDGMQTNAYLPAGLTVSVDMGFQNLPNGQNILPGVLFVQEGSNFAFSVYLNITVTSGVVTQVIMTCPAFASGLIPLGLCTVSGNSLTIPQFTVTTNLSGANFLVNGTSICTGSNPNYVMGSGQIVLQNSLSSPSPIIQTYDNFSVTSSYVSYFNSVYNSYFPLQSRISMDVFVGSNSSNAVNYTQVLVPYLSDGEFLHYILSWDPSGNPTTVTLIAQNGNTGVVSVYLGNLSASSLGITGNAFTGTISCNLALESIGTQRIVQVNGVTVGTGTSDVDASTVPSAVLQISPPNSDGATYFAIDNLLITSPTAGAYNSSAILKTLTLPHSMSIARFAAGWSQSLPAGTSLTMQLSLDGGTNWQTVTSGQLLDGTVAPWNGTATDFRLMATLSTTNQNLTPVLGPIVASSSRI